MAELENWEDEGEMSFSIRLSSNRIGRLYPVLLDAYGNIIDGLHRLEADPDWPKLRLGYIKSDEDRLVARLIANTCRRSVSDEEKREILRKLGALYIKSGVKPGTELANKISERTGMSYRWVMKYLPDEFKERPGIGGPRSFASMAISKQQKGRLNDEVRVARRATLHFEDLLTHPSKKVLTVKKFANVDFVQVLLEKQFYDDIERLAEKLGVKAEVIISNALVWLFRKLMEYSKTRSPFLVT